MLRFEKGYETPPFGPLTRADFVTICNAAFYDGGGTRQAQELAKSRGIASTDFMRMQRDEMLARAQTRGQAIVPHVISSGESPDGSSWTTYSDGETLITDESGVQFYNE